MTELPALDTEILEALASGPHPVSALIGTHPRATVYRRVAVLRAEGFIARSQRGYTLTSVGEHALAEHDAQVFTDGLGGFYPPLREVPTPQYAALFELILGAVALRQHTDHDRPHPSFAIVGPTLRWKSSFAECLAVALGVDPAAHIADLRTERGQSLWIRRDASGEVVSRRDLLTAPIAIFDEYQAADTAVRRAVAPFLAGRRRLPMENDIIALAPVALVVMNPAPGGTLVARTTFNEAQLRRLFPLDVTALPMPDLALTGGRAVMAARQTGALTIPAPRVSVDLWRESVVHVLRDVLTPDGLRLIDVDVVLGVGRGMTAWLPAPVALRQTLYNILLVTETVGWVKPAWVDRIRSFPHGTRKGSSVIVPQVSAARPRTIALFPERGQSAEEGESMSARESIMPSFVLSESSKADLVWLSREAGLSPDAAVSLLVDQYRLMRSEGGELEDLQAAVRLRKECADAEVSTADLREHLELKAALTQQGLSVHEVRQAVELGITVDAAGLTWEQVREVAEVLAKLRAAGIDITVLENLEKALTQYANLGHDTARLTGLAALSSRLDAAGIALDELGRTLDHLQTLCELGLDQDTAAALASALDSAGITKQNRTTVLERVAAIGCTDAVVARMEREKTSTLDDLTALQTAVSERQHTLAKVKAEIVSATAEPEGKHQEILDQEGIERYNALVTVEAFERFLIQHTARNDPFWTTLDLLLEMKRRHPRGTPPPPDWLTAELQQRIKTFLEQLVANGNIHEQVRGEFVTGTPARPSGERR
jgi:hypothetical protein